jgi:alpha-tubulin suppressor-like RCC1 family protein
MFGGIGWKIIAMAKKGAAAAVYGLFGWGRNNSGQLGLGNNLVRSSPIQVGTNSDWNSISCSSIHTLAIKNGQLWAWGANSNGQLGTNNLITQSSPVQVGTDTNWSSVAAMNASSFAIKTNCTLWSWGFNTIYGFLEYSLFILFRYELALSLMLRVLIHDQFELCKLLKSIFFND